MATDTDVPKTYTHGAPCKKAHDSVFVRASSQSCPRCLAVSAWCSRDHNDYDKYYRFECTTTTTTTTTLLGRSNAIRTSRARRSRDIVLSSVARLRELPDRRFRPITEYRHRTGRQKKKKKHPIAVSFSKRDVGFTAGSVFLPDATFAPFTVGVPVVVVVVVVVLTTARNVRGRPPRPVGNVRHRRLHRRRRLTDR